jgi:hypothetical protein
MNTDSRHIRMLFLIPAVLLMVLSSCGKTSNNQSTTATPITTEAQALAVASGYVPSEILTKARVVVGNAAYVGTPTGSYRQWDVQLYDIAVTKAELGWNLDSKTELGTDEPYTEIEIKLNASTGELVARKAYIPQIW